MAGSVKFPYKRVEPTIDRFINVCRIDLDRVKRHKHNLKQMLSAQNWENLNKEQLNASRTIKQMGANMRELQKTRSKVVETDIDKFDAKVKDVSDECVAAVLELGQLYHETEDAAPKQPPSGEPVDGENEPLMTSSMHVPRVHTVDSPSLSLEQQQEQLQAQRMAEESLEGLGHSIDELNALMKEFANAVHEQGKKVDDIDSNLEKASKEVEKGTDYLEKALKLKTAVYPIAGAIVGGAMGGPVGLVAGLKLGAVAAGVGGLAGFGFGKIIDNVQTSHIDENKENTTEKNIEMKKPMSKSIPAESKEDDVTEHDKGEKMKPTEAECTQGQKDETKASNDIQDEGVKNGKT